VRIKGDRSNRRESLIIGGLKMGGTSTQLPHEYASSDKVPESTTFLIQRGSRHTQYRDSVRRFIKGDPGLVGEIANRIQGSPDLYWYGVRRQAVAINTSMPSSEDIFDSEGGPRVDSAEVIVGGRSIMVLVA
jgi:hypothetical protein